MHSTSLRLRDNLPAILQLSDSSTKMRPSDNRPMVTGIGVLAANGIGVRAFWESLVAGRSGVGPITLFDASAMRCRIAAEAEAMRSWSDAISVARVG